MNKIKDNMVKIGFKNIPVRLILVKLVDVWQEVKSHNINNKAGYNLLGKALAASSLLMSNIKMEGSVSLQIRTENHPLSMLVTECNHKFGMRGIVKIQDNIDSKQLDLDMKSLSSSNNAHFIVNILPDNKHLKPYQGIIPISINDDGFSIQNAISNYMRDSQQIDTGIWLASDDNTVACILLQKMPIDGGYSQDLEDDWLTIKHLTSTIKTNELLELDLLTIVQLLFNEYIEQEKVIVLEEKPLHFYCTCSRQKAENAIKMELFASNIDDVMAGNSYITVDCDFCAKKYGFNYSDCVRIYHS